MSQTRRPKPIAIDGVAALEASLSPTVRLNLPATTTGRGFPIPIPPESRRPRTKRLSNDEWEALQDRLFYQTKDQFFEALAQFGLMDWSLARIIHWVLSFNEKVLDDEMVAAVKRIDAQVAAEEVEDAFLDGVR